ncbi:hypothetical protein F5880DRAFT_1697720 [Lentinula raphanica]|nr:hypothetical protein F5880DRAFT_1697720 [Lentinula raphanica]
MSWPFTYFNAVLLLRAVSQTIPTSRSTTTIFRASPMKKSAKPIGTSRKWWIWLGRLGDSMEDKCSRGLDAMSLREDFKAHFQIVCDQCRSWGNVQTAGPATAMKIFFALNSSSKIVIQRSELAALSNTPNRFSESIQAATRFMSMAQLPAHADPEERIDNNNVRGGFGDDFSATDTYVFQKRIHTRAPYIRIAGAECLRYSSAG